MNYFKRKRAPTLQSLTLSPQKINIIFIPFIIPYRNLVAKGEIRCQKHIFRWKMLHNLKE